ncbi:MAG: dUTP diphosphatase [Candidatus Nomurabacteria bacterium]|nr:MAG: dUTP diphosphatase [Candidatus Nomurabacteria bacterium]
MKVRVQKLHEDAKLPEYAHGEEDAAIDLCTTEAGVIPAGQARGFGTGLAFEIPLGHVGLVWDRSGLAFKHGITILGGMIDPGYRGEIKVMLLNTSGEDYTVEKGERIAQFLIFQSGHVEIEEAAELSATARGEGGFGSTGRS